MPIGLSPSCVLPLPLGLSSPLYFCFLSLGRLCQRSHQTVPVSVLCVGSAYRPRHWPGASKWTPKTCGGGICPQRRLLGPRMSTCGVTSPTRAQNNLPPVHSHAQSSLWRAHNAPPPPCVRGGCIVSPFPCVAWVPSGMVCNGWHKVTGKGVLFSRVARVPGSMVGGGWQN